MAEVIGVVAAATQLAATCMTLLDLMSKIKRAPSALRDYQNQLQELGHLSEAISQNPLLQTPEVGTHTSSILTTITENNLKPLFQRGRFFRYWTWFYKERDLCEIFVNLERRKTSLSLIIHHLQARAIHQIRMDITTMSGSKKNSQSDSTYSSEMDSASEPALSRASKRGGDLRTLTSYRAKQLPTKSARSSMETTCPAKETSKTSTTGEPRGAQMSRGSELAKKPGIASEEPLMATSSLAPEAAITSQEGSNTEAEDVPGATRKKSSRNVWRGNIATGYVRQLNGLFIHSSASTATRDAAVAYHTGNDNTFEGNILDKTPRSSRTDDVRGLKRKAKRSKRNKEGQSAPPGIDQINGTYIGP